MNKHLVTAALFFGITTVCILLFHWVEFMLGLSASEEVRWIVAGGAAFIGGMGAMFRVMEEGF